MGEWVVGRAAGGRRDLDLPGGAPIRRRKKGESEGGEGGMVVIREKVERNEEEDIDVAARGR